jgi:hypothetical protein
MLAMTNLEAPTVGVGLTGWPTKRSLVET